MNSAKHQIVIASKTVTVTVTTSRVGRQHDVAVSAYSAADHERQDVFLRRCKRLRYCDDNLLLSLTCLMTLTISVVITDTPGGHRPPQ